MGRTEEGSKRQTAEAAKTYDGIRLAKSLRRHCGRTFRRKVTDCGTKCLHHPCGSGGNRPHLPLPWRTGSAGRCSAPIRTPFYELIPRGPLFKLGRVDIEGFKSI